MAAGTVEQLANLPVTTLNNGGVLTSGATSCTVTSAATFPATGNFRLEIAPFGPAREIIVVTAVAGNVFTLLRGQEGTAAVSHNDGSAVVGVLTKGALNQIQQCVPVFTNTASLVYTMDSTGNPFDVLILHNRAGARASYILPVPTAGRTIQLDDISNNINTSVNQCYLIPNLLETIDGAQGVALSGTFNCVNGNTSVGTTGNSQVGILHAGMSVLFGNDTQSRIVNTVLAATITLSTAYGGTTNAAASGRVTSLVFATNLGRLLIKSDGTNWITSNPAVQCASIQSESTLITTVGPLATTTQYNVLQTNSGVEFGAVTADFGSGVGVIGVTRAVTDPANGPIAGGGTLLFSSHTAGHFRGKGSRGATVTMVPAGNPSAVNSQTQVYDTQFGTAETVSSAAATAILAYTTTTTTGGWITIRLVSRATTATTGVVIGDIVAATYVLAYTNIAGTVTLSVAAAAAGAPILVGASQTTSTVMTSILTATAAGAVITFFVTNLASITTDSEVFAEIVQN